MKIYSMKNTTELNRKAVFDLFLVSFCQDPFTRWMFPNVADYTKYFPQFAEAFGGRAFECESVAFLEGYKGAVLCLPPRVYPDEEKLNALMRDAISDKIKDDVITTFRKKEDYCPSCPYWYIPVIGVDPYYHSKGYGSALLSHIFQDVVKRDEAVYLESSTERNLSFYERHGFSILGEVQSGSSPKIFPMIRNPQ